MPFEIQHQPDLGAIGTAARYAGTGMRLERERQFKEREAGRREQAREFDEQMDFRYTSLEAQAAEAEKAQQAAAERQQALIDSNVEQADLARKQAKDLAESGDKRARDLADQVDTRARDLSAQSLTLQGERLKESLQRADDQTAATLLSDGFKMISNHQMHRKKNNLVLDVAAAAEEQNAIANLRKYASKDSPASPLELMGILGDVIAGVEERTNNAQKGMTFEDEAREGHVALPQGDGSILHVFKPGIEHRLQPPPDGAVTPKLEAEQKAKREQAVYGLVGKIKEEVWDPRAQAFRKVYYKREDADAMIAARTAPTSQDLRSIDEFQTTYKIEGEARRLGTTPQKLMAIIERAAGGDYKAAQLLIDMGVTM